MRLKSTSVREKFRQVVEKHRYHPEFIGIEVLYPNQPGALDDTLLHLAARTGAVEDMRVLISAGADIDAVGDLGNTPLHQAAMMGAADSVRLLLQLGARADLKNEFDQTARDVAEVSGRSAIVELFPR